MKVFEIAQLMNDKLNGGNKSKFSVSLAIVGEIICLCNLRLGGGVETPISFLSSAFVDDHIRLLINELDNESELKMIENVQNFFESHYRSECERSCMLSKIKNIGIGILGLLGLAVIVLRLIS